MVSPSELTLDCKPHGFSMPLKCFGDQTDQTYKLQEFLSRLEEERLKIDGLKRELPLCIHLLTNAMDASRQQLQVFRTNQGARPVLEEFMPMKHSNSGKHEKASMNSDMANWMTTSQICSQANEGTKPQSGIPSPQETEIGLNIVCPKLALKPKHRNGGAFLPFSKDRNSSTDSIIRALPELSLASSEKDMEDKKSSEPDQYGVRLCPRRETCAKAGTGGVVAEQEKRRVSHSEVQTATASAIYKPSNQPHRKIRRCWSPDLHRRFVNALQMLGGCQVATPKQIRELMKVDGLTNDEVKSHLQKYRLHTRRPSLSPQAAGAPGPQLVLLRGIWFPPEYASAAAAHTGSHSLYTTHPAPHAAPSPYCAATPVPPEFYTAASSQPPLPPPPDHHPLHHQVHMYNKATSHRHSSPESDIRGNGDRSESIEDGKYEDSSSKGTENGENEGERKGLAALRGDGDESNESEITLKF